MSSFIVIYNNQILSVQNLDFIQCYCIWSSKLLCWNIFYACKCHTAEHRQHKDKRGILCANTDSYKNQKYMHADVCTCLLYEQTVTHMGIYTHTLSLCVYKEMAKCQAMCMATSCWHRSPYFTAAPGGDKEHPSRGEEMTVHTFPTQQTHPDPS